MSSLTLPPNSATLHTLSNGLEVIILEDDAHPLVSVQLWVKAGSLHEEAWTGAGLAHLTEHMFFKGTEQRTAPQISQEIQARGGYVNAYTTFNRTVYWIDGVAEHVNGYLDIIADITRGSIFHADELIKEQEVIRREFAMDNDDPQSVAQHLLQATAFREHPLRHPIMGHLEIFNQVGREDLMRFVHRHYVPNNCFLVIAGAVNTEALLKCVEQHFGTWQRRPYEPVVLPIEPVQLASRRAEKEFNTDIVRLNLGWHIQGDTHPDRPALDVLGFILGSGRSSRLGLELRERLGVAHWVGAGAWSALDLGLFAAEAECDAEDLAQVVDGLWRVLSTLKSDGCTTEELDKAVRATLSAQLKSRCTTRGMASSLGHSWLAVGNLDYDRHYLEQVSTLTVEAVTQTARQYLTEAGLSRIALYPTGILKKKALNGSRATREKAQRFELSNGMTLLVGENPRMPLVSTRVQFLAGVPVETDSNAGITQVTAQMLLKGTANRSDEQIAALLEDRGGSLLANGDAHRLLVGADVMKGDNALAYELLRDLLLSPTFPAEHLPKVKKRQTAAIREELEDPLTVGMRRARKNLFATLPYARTALGTLESVESLDTSLCRALWQERVQAQNGVISVFGDVKADEVLAEMEQLFGPIVAGAKSQAGFTSMNVTATPRAGHITLDKEQGVIVFAFPTVGLQAAEAPILQLIDEACSDMGSRLFNRIREEMGLAYYVGAQCFHALGAGAFYFYVGTDPQKINLAKEELLSEIAALAQNGLEADELERAKTTWKSTWLRQQQGNGAMADALGWEELNGHGHGRHAELPQMMQAITVEQVQEVAARFLNPSQVFEVTVSP
ncbi:MAG: M16 family metallopeptidase [Roseimicrobium sp.]